MSNTERLVQRLVMASLLSFLVGCFFFLTASKCKVLRSMGFIWCVPWFPLFFKRLCCASSKPIFIHFFKWVKFLSTFDHCPLVRRCNTYMMESLNCISVIRAEKGWKEEAERGQKWIEHERSDWWFILCGMFSQMAGSGMAFCQNKAIIYD